MACAHSTAFPIRSEDEIRDVHFNQLCVPCICAFVMFINAKHLCGNRFQITQSDEICLYAHFVSAFISVSRSMYWVDSYVTFLNYMQSTIWQLYIEIKRLVFKRDIFGNTIIIYTYSIKGLYQFVNVFSSKNLSNFRFWRPSYRLSDFLFFSLTMNNINKFSSFWTNKKIKNKMLFSQLVYDWNIITFDFDNFRIISSWWQNSRLLALSSFIFYSY